MKAKTDQANPAAPASPLNVPALAITLLIGLVAAGLVMAQFHYAQDPSSQISLSNLNSRVPMLESTTNWVTRDSYCVGLSAYGRALDQALAPDARVYMSGMIGDNGGSLGYYYFLRNYLFPRHLEISLDGKGVFVSEGIVSGIASDDPELIRSNGFDLFIRFTNNNMQLIPLTPKGELKQQ
jgi:hypothetical protein